MNDKDKKQPDYSLLQTIIERGDIAEAILSFLKGKTVQECIDILDAVKRRMLAETKV